MIIHANPARAHALTAPASFFFTPIKQGVLVDVVITNPDSFLTVYQINVAKYIWNITALCIPYSAQ